MALMNRIPFVPLTLVDQFSLLSKWITKPAARSQTHMHRSHAPLPEFKLDVRADDTGTKYLYFDFMSVSDPHLGTRHSRAKRLCQMLEHTQTKHFKAVGDNVDLVYMVRKSTWNFAQWHYQALAHLIRKKATLFPGNHDPTARGTIVYVDGKPRRRRYWLGKNIFGMPIVDEERYIDPKGRVVHITHGDIYDNIVFGKRKGAWYHIGDALHQPLADLDTLVQTIPKFDGFSIAAKAKRAIKTIINRGLGVDREITKSLDADPAINALLYGHSHMGGIKKTPGGKLILNDGCCTEHVQAMVHDKHGTFALITWHRDRIDIEEENGSTRTLYWKSLGLSHFENPPTKIEDDCTKKASRLVRILYRLATPKDRQKIIQIRQDASKQKRAIPDFPRNISLPPHPCRAEQAQRRSRLYSESLRH